MALPSVAFEQHGAKSRELKFDSMGGPKTGRMAQKLEGGHSNRVIPHFMSRVNPYINTAPEGPSDSRPWEI